MTGKILKIEDGTVTIGVDDGRMIRIPIADVTYLGPKAGERVELYRNGNEWAASKMEEGSYRRQNDYNYGHQTYYSETADSRIRTYNKHIFTWLFAAALGGFGVDRFCRGQIGLGIVKLLTGGGFFFWWFADFVIALEKAYGSSYRGIEEFTFRNGKYDR